MRISTTLAVAASVLSFIECGDNDDVTKVPATQVPTEVPVEDFWTVAGGSLQILTGMSIIRL